MRILVLGAAGKAARATVYSLLGTRGVEHIYLADREAEALNKLGAELHGRPVSMRFLDAESERGLRERMAEADLVLGCLGPFHHHEARILEAALEARRDYISLCDDGEATAVALSLAPDAEKRGVKVLCGCGMTPGLSNLLASRAASRLQETHGIEISWYLGTGSRLGAATIQHLLKISHGRAVSLEGGRGRKVLAGSGEELVEFPPPVGWRVVSFLAHPEPSTLPRSVGKIMEVGFKGGVGARLGGMALQWLAWLGEGEKSPIWKTALQTVADGVTNRGGGPSPSALRVTATGMRGGADSKVTFAVTGDYYRLSGMMATAAVEQWMGGGWPCGVYPPEMILDEPLFYSRLRRRGLRVLVGEERGGGGVDGRMMTA